MGYEVLIWGRKKKFFRRPREIIDFTILGPKINFKKMSDFTQIGIKMGFCVTWVSNHFFYDFIVLLMAMPLARKLSVTYGFLN